MSEARIAGIRDRLATEGVDAFLVKKGANIRYLSGFTSEDAHLFITSDQAYLVTDFRYYEQAERQAPAFELFKVAKPLPEALSDLVRETGVARLAFESPSVTYAQYQELAGIEGLTPVPVKGWVEEQRAVKTQEEIALIRRAVAIGDAAIAALPALLRPEMTEKELAWELEVFIRTHGADDIGFPIIVAGGPNGAMPHAVPSDRVLVAGEPIVLDFGAQVDGYRSDLTRTVCIGQPDDRFREIHAIVLAAQQKAESGLRPGLLGKEADALARQVITDAGYADAFGHGLGHGVGLEIHERPSAGPRSDDTLEADMLVTVEPGIYLPGWGGVRIEDLVLITDSGAEVLTGATREPVLPR